MSNIPRMNEAQYALAAEIRAEAAVQRVTAVQLQRAAGISKSAYANYFTRCTRDVPMGVVVAVAEALGMTGSELLHRAEERAAHSALDPETVAESALSALPAASQAAIRAAGADLRPRFADPQTRLVSNGDDRH